MTPEEAHTIVMTIIGGQYIERWPESKRNAIFCSYRLIYQKVGAHLPKMGAYIYQKLTTIFFNLLAISIWHHCGGLPQKYQHITYSTVYRVRVL